MLIKVLDHGYVRFIEAWGAGEDKSSLRGPCQEIYDIDYECGIIEAARQSTQGSFRGWEQDQELLAYLFNNRPPHATPFEFAGAVIEVRAPIMVFREWHRHRTQSYNEMSARYAPLPDMNYLPTVERCFATNEKNKQAGTLKDSDVLTSERAMLWLDALERYYEIGEKLYQQGLQTGIPKELARLCIPVGRYSQMRASANLRNWLAFMTLRADPHAQWEIQQYANAVGQILEAKFPRTWELYVNRK